MMSEISGSFSSSSSGPKPSSSSISTFSSANCSRRLSVIFSSASTSMMIGRNSSESSSLLRVEAASGSTRSSRRGSTCSLILWTLASKPSALAGPSLTPLERSASRVIASAFTGICVGGAIGATASPGIGGNWSPPGTGAWPSPPPPPRIGRATPKLGRAPAPIPPTPFLRPNALIRFSRPEHRSPASSRDLPPVNDKTFEIFLTRRPRSAFCRGG